LGCITCNPKAAILLDMLTADAGGSSATLPRRIGHPIFGRSVIKVAAERARHLRQNGVLPDLQLHPSPHRN
jgi:hypothetical protein